MQAGQLLSTSCGSPHYVAPEILSFDGTARCSDCAAYTPPMHTSPLTPTIHTLPPPIHNSHVRSHAHLLGTPPHNSPRLPCTQNTFCHARLGDRAAHALRPNTIMALSPLTPPVQASHSHPLPPMHSSEVRPPHLPCTRNTFCQARPPLTPCSPCRHRAQPPAHSPQARARGLGPHCALCCV